MSGSGDQKTLYLYRRLPGTTVLEADRRPYHPDLEKTLAIASGSPESRFQALEEQLLQYSKTAGDCRSSTRLEVARANRNACADDSFECMHT
jgi:hypothetical protein